MHNIPQFISLKLFFVGHLYFRMFRNNKKKLSSVVFKRIGTFIDNKNYFNIYFFSVDGIILLSATIKTNKTRN